MVQCRDCKLLMPRRGENGGKAFPWYYRCEMGRFDKGGKPRYYAIRGIWAPNKSVATAQANCPFFIEKDWAAEHREAMEKFDNSLDLPLEEKPKTNGG